MSCISVADKAGIVKKYQINEKDTGSSQVQVAILTAQINKLTDHFKINKHDHHSRRGLLHKVNHRRKLLSYLKSKSMDKYATLIKQLKLRK
ncbi:MAG: 30S ribosomal protein S15 [Gammaproteobacteria bacterium]|nr:MAG: 30S ribosomal protein S15 [Gammaproteobacteria bacterium]